MHWTRQAPAAGGKGGNESSVAGVLWEGSYEPGSASKDALKMLSSWAATAAAPVE